MVGDASTHRAALFEALARDEAAGRRGLHPTAVGQRTRQRFQGPIGSGDPRRLVPEHGALPHPGLFAVGRTGGVDASEDEKGSGR